MSFYNTTHERGQTLQLFEHQADNQDQAVLRWFLANPDTAVNRDQLHRYVLQSAPATSLGRSLNTLMRDGLIEKLDTKQPGRWGRPQHLWRLIRRDT